MNDERPANEATRAYRKREEAAYPHVEAEVREARDALWVARIKKLRDYWDWEKPHRSSNPNTLTEINRAVGGCRDDLTALLKEVDDGE